MQVVQDQERALAGIHDLAQHERNPFERKQAQLCSGEVGGISRRRLPLGKDEPQPLIER